MTPRKKAEGGHDNLVYYDPHSSGKELKSLQCVIRSNVLDGSKHVFAKTTILYHLFQNDREKYPRSFGTN